MRNLFDILLRYSRWIVFTFYVVLSCVLLFDGDNPYQHHVYLTSANDVTSSVFRFTNNITSYFHLRDINEELQRQNANLELEVMALKDKIKEYDARMYADTMSRQPELSDYEFIIAHVISNSIAKPRNYITIDKGATDGVKPEMGVIDQNGIIGIVDVVGEHNSRVISLLNSNFRLSCKVKKNDYFGSLVWDGKNSYEAVVEELPRHAKISQGDTIVTSGYSAVFPEGVSIGVISGFENSDNTNFYTIRVKLFTDFAKLSTVKVIINKQYDELRALQVTETESNE